MTTNPGIADWKRVEPRGRALGRLLVRLASTIRRRSLDRALARGLDPASSPALAHRAARLTSRRARRGFAGCVADVIVTAEQPPILPSLQVLPSRSEVLASRAALRSVEELLISELPVYAEGIARLEMLLTDGASPLFPPDCPGALRDELERIVAALEGREEDW